MKESVGQTVGIKFTTPLYRPMSGLRITTVYCENYKKYISRLCDQKHRIFSA